MKNKDNENCSICMEIKRNPIILECQHSFCTECVLSYLHYSASCHVTCPLCRAILNSHHILEILKTRQRKRQLIKILCSILFYGGLSALGAITAFSIVSLKYT
ncbi:tripartite motif-containing protein 73-like [Teleopsis dalmanni]|uniref:tripartite motif-containing protein 73-like n=1 Tax=Teleopsis dalmanni TaxID=139649 RepID=UPI000D32C731|nr:tripartite motif-containing protein 73-like [Teleopsis dalmanni]XP_037940138.1 tripartite motif-containing protein 73-like [Teleopsis dalmanni]